MPDRLRRGGFWFLLGLLLLSYCAVSTATLVDLRRDASLQATMSANDLVAALSREIRGHLRAYDAVLQRVDQRLHAAWFERLDPAARQAELFDAASVDPFLTSVFVADATGTILWDRDNGASGLAPVADRPWFRTQRDTVDAGLVMSEPFTRESDAFDPLVAISRRLTSENGSFEGVVVGLVRVEVFLRIMRESRLAPGDAITLFNREGVLVARLPHRPQAIGQDLSQDPQVARFLQAESGQFTGRTAVDGLTRIHNFVRLRSVPVTIDVALAETNVFAAWNWRALTTGLVLTLLSALAVTLAVLIRREFRRRLETERDLRRADEQYRLLADYSTDLIIRLDADLARRYVSPASIPMLGYTPEEMLGRLSRSLIHPDDWSEVQCIAANARQSNTGTEATYRLLTKAGSYIWVEGRYSHVAADGGFIVVLRNISKRRQVEEKLAAAHAELTALANTDALTGLANRRRFDEALESLCAAPDEPPFALLMMDIDRFKQFNDRYGHPAGDGCLRAVAEVVRSALPGKEALAVRIGGEELAALLPGQTLAEAQDSAERIRRAVETLAIAHEGNRSNGGVVTISVGCAEGAATPGARGQILSDADEMLYEAKRTGRNRVCSRLTLDTLGENAPSPTEASRGDEPDERARLRRRA